MTQFHFPFWYLGACSGKCVCPKRVGVQQGSVCTPTNSSDTSSTAGISIRRRCQNCLLQLSWSIIGRELENIRFDLLLTRVTIMQRLRVYH